MDDLIAYGLIVAAFALGIGFGFAVQRHYWIRGVKSLIRRKAKDKKKTDGEE